MLVMTITTGSLHLDISRKSLTLFFTTIISSNCIITLLFYQQFERTTLKLKLL